MPENGTGCLCVTSYKKHLHLYEYPDGNPPANFSKTVHNCTDERKGFMVWKDMLEELYF